jgi:DNA-binding MarR family transcriptional regulator
MTHPNGGTTVQPTLGRAVGQAEASLSRLLNRMLAARSVSRELYLGVQRLTILGGQAAPDAFTRDLTDWLDLDAPAAAQLVSQLEAAGLTETTGGLTRLTPAGHALRDGILAESAAVTGPLLATLDRADLEVTIRTLGEITRLVRGVPVPSPS